MYVGNLVLYCEVIIHNLNAETADESDEEVVAGEYEAKASTKKEKKRQEREAQRQVHFLSLFLFLYVFLSI